MPTSPPAAPPGYPLAGYRPPAQSGWPPPAVPSPTHQVDRSAGSVGAGADHLTGGPPRPGDAVDHGDDGPATGTDGARPGHRSTLHGASTSQRREPSPTGFPPATPPAGPGGLPTGYGQPGYPPPGYERAGYDQRGYPQPGYGQPAQGQPVYPQQGDGHPGYGPAGGAPPRPAEPGYAPPTQWAYGQQPQAGPSPYAQQTGATGADWSRYGWGGHGPATIGYVPGQFGYGAVPEAWPTQVLPSEDEIPSAGLPRRILARLVDLVIALVLLLIPFAMIDNDRPLAHFFVGLVGMAAYEAVFLTWTGATPGKLLFGLRVSELGLPGPVSPAVAIRRGLLVGVLFPLGGFGAFGDATAPVLLGLLVLLPGAMLALASAVSAPLRRTFVDRFNGTMAVGRSAPATVTTEDLDRWTDIETPPEMTPQGPAATRAQRRRARTARLDDAPLLVLALAVAAVIFTVGVSSGWKALAAAWTVWFVAFVIDETWRIARYGGTAGHRGSGLAVVDMTTGEPPSPGRSFARALVLGVVLYTVVLLPVVEIWMRVARYNRGPHDLVGHTVVVAVTARAAEEVARASTA